METKKVTIWEEDYMIPTYKVYPPEKNPLFIEKRVYQGSSIIGRQRIFRWIIRLRKIRMVPARYISVRRIVCMEIFQDDIALRNTQYCNYLRALGCLGLGRQKEAAELLDDVLEKQKDYQGAIAHRCFC